MNWDNLRIFLAVAREGSLSGAARTLGVRHTTVARRLNGFEVEVGARLFDRLRTGFVLTPAGEDMAGVAARVEQEMLGVGRRVLGRDTSLQGPLRVSTADAMANTFLMPLFARFASDYPGVDLSITASNAAISLRQREADVALRATNNPPDDLIGRRLCRLAFAVYGTHDYVGDVRNGGALRWIGADGGMPHQSWLRSTIGQHEVALTVDEASLTHRALHQARAVGLMPCFMGDPDPELCRYAEPPRSVGLDLWFLIHGDLRRTARVRVFRDFIVEQVRGLTPMLEGAEEIDSHH